MSNVTTRRIPGWRPDSGRDVHVGSTPKIQRARERQQRNTTKKQLFRSEIILIDDKPEQPDQKNSTEYNLCLLECAIDQK